MSRQTSAPAPQQAQSLMSRLAQAVGGIEPDDLSGLAQMHGWCEARLDLRKQEPGVFHEDAAAKLSQITQRLETLILGEASDALQELTQVTQAVSQMSALMPIGSAPQAETTDTPASLSDKQVAEKLDDLFAEADSTEDAALAAAVDTEPAPISKTEPTPAAPASEPESGHVAEYVAEPLLIDAKEFDFVKGFVEEAKEHIEAIEAAVLEVERAPDDAAKIDDLFRPFHTIKGMAGFLNLRDVSSLTHEVETLLDQGRKGKRVITHGVIDLVLNVVDLLKAQVAGIGQWVDSPEHVPVQQPPVADMIERLRNVVAGRMQAEEFAATPSASVSPIATPPQNNVQTPAPGAGSKTVTSSPSPATAASPEAVPATAPTQSKKGDQSIRIDTEKLDALIDMVGELVIAQTLVNMSGDVAANPKLTKNVTQVTKIVRDVQEMTMAMRMVPIGPTFQKMARLVRDVSRKANKQVNLTISGEDTELDKTVIQEIGDPLVHMVRNAVDHGIESQDARLATGKPEFGKVHLHAGHEGGNIVISISDDGKGLDPAVLIAKAIEKGLIEPDAELTEQQAYNLVFAPGFSTAAQVTDISGRGVGMDVVKRNIESLRGHTEITSRKGQGTVFTIRLPLTLAIIDGMVVCLGGERFIIPTITIQQSLRPPAGSITTVQHRGEVLNVRGELIPLIQLGELFGLTGRIDPCEAMVVIAHCEGRLIGLVVQELIGQQQVVIKTLGERFEKLSGISGAAILGDGRVGLILEMVGIAAAHDARQVRGASPGSRSRHIAQAIAAGESTVQEV